MNSARHDRVERLLRRMTVDAQCRDWTAERPDRVGFARLGQARLMVGAAARAHGTAWPGGTLRAGVGVGATIAYALVVLVLVPHPAAPLTLAAALAGAVPASHLAVGALIWVRRQRARRAKPGTALIDDPDLVAGLVREIKVLRVAGRLEVAEEMGWALAWLRDAQGQVRPRV